MRGGEVEPVSILYKLKCSGMPERDSVDGRQYERRERGGQAGNGRMTTNADVENECSNGDGGGLVRILGV